MIFESGTIYNIRKGFFPELCVSQGLSKNTDTCTFVALTDVVQSVTMPSKSTVRDDFTLNTAR